MEIPPNIGRDIQRTAPEQPADPKTVFEDGLGLFGSPGDAALLDEVVSIAYEERRPQKKKGAEQRSP